MSSVVVKKAKIKDDLFLEVEYSENLANHQKKDTKLSCTIPVHDDLKESFKKLEKHLAVICDEIKTKGKVLADFESDDFTKYHVKGFSISGNDENEGVTIHGHKEGKYGDVNLNTPFTKWESEDYPFASELSECVENCVYEVEQYLFEGKRAPERQLEMAFMDDLEAAENEANNQE